MRVTSLYYRLLLLLVFAVVPSFMHAQDSVWTKPFGGTNIDVAYAIEEAFDEGYIIAGYTRSYGTASGRNLWLFKTDKHGNLIWNKTFGGNSDDEAAAVKQTLDGGFIAAGYTSSFGNGAKDVYVVKTDSLGNEVWSRTFGGSSDEEAYALEVLPDGGYLIGGATSSSGAGSRDGWLIRLNSLGNSVWAKTIGGLSTDGIRGLQRTADNAFIITGWTASDGAGVLGNAWLVKTDTAGNILFNKNFGGSDADRGLSVQQTADGGYILTGYTASSGAGLDDVFLVKTDAAGNQTWAKTFGGTGRDYGNAVKQTADGGYLIAGYTLSYGAGGDDVWIVKTDTGGTLTWSKTFGGTASDVGYSMDLTSDGGYVVAGHTLSSGAGMHDAWLIRHVPPVIPVELITLSALFDGKDVLIQWTTATETNNKGWEIEVSDGIKFVCIGYVAGAGSSINPREYSFRHASPKGNQNLYRLKQIDFDGSVQYSQVIETTHSTITSFQLHANYPNPFNPETIISFSVPEQSEVSLIVYNTLGEVVRVLVNRTMAAGTHSVVFHGTGLPSGVYFYEMVAKGYREVKKMVVIR